MAETANLKIQHRMKTAAVIAEFNPLHNGHACFLDEVRKRSHADCILVIMSGDFVQRGEPAVLNKYIRAQAALCCGADLVLELPVRTSSAGAGEFALGAVSILNALGIVDELWFGSEDGNTETFLNASEILFHETDEFKKELSEGLKKGLPYPEARALAILHSVPPSLFNKTPEQTLEFLESPNNILGLEYCLALKKLGSSIQPMTVERIGGRHNEPNLSGTVSSASSIRKSGILQAESAIPKAAFELYRSYFSEFDPVFADDFSLMLKYKLMSCSASELRDYNDVTDDLSKRIVNNLNRFYSFTQFADLLKTRNLTRTHVNRALLHILLNIRSCSGRSTCGHVRILGLGNCGNLLSAVKEHGTITLFSAPSQVKNTSYDEDLFASNLYETVGAIKSGAPFVHEAERRLIKVFH